MPSHSFTSHKLAVLGYDIPDAPAGAHVAFKKAAASVGFHATVGAGDTWFPLPDTCLQGEFANHESALRALAEALILASADVGAVIRLSRWAMIGPDGQATVSADDARKKMGLGGILGAYQTQGFGALPGSQMLGGIVRR